MKIHIIGTAGSGKSTIARQLARGLACPHIELDALYWTGNWQRTSPRILRAKVYSSLRGGRWVIDGDYEVVRDLIWLRVNKVLWLDYSLPLLCWRLACRGLRQVLTQENLWGTESRESWRSFLSPKSLLIRSLAAHSHWRAKYEALAHCASFSHIEFVRLQSPHATERYISALV